MTAIPYIPCNTTNYSVGRVFPDGPLRRRSFAVDSVALHRTAITGDTAASECTNYTKPNKYASFHEAIGLDGKRCRSVRAQDRAWAVIGGAFVLPPSLLYRKGRLIVDSRIANFRSYSIELCGLNGTALTAPQIASVIQAIKDVKAANPAVVLKHLTVAGLKAGQAGLYNHHDATVAFAVQNGHQDFILNADWVKIMAGLA